MKNWQYFKTKPQPLLTKYDRWRERSKLIGLSKPAQLKLDWLIFYQTKANRNVSLVCRHFGISRKTFHKWLKRFNELDLTSLEEHSRAPKHVRRPDYTTKELIRVEKLKQRYPTAGREKLAVLYLEDFGQPIKAWSLRRIIHDKGWYAQRAIKTRRQKVQTRVIKKKRLTELTLKAQTGFLVECDGITIYFSNQKRYIFTAIDYHTRFGFAYMYKTKGSANAADFLRRLVLLFGGSIENIHIDNGSEFMKEFVVAAQNLQINLYHARPYQPKDKPFIERFNGNLQQEWIDLGHLTSDVDQFNTNLTDYLIYYNFKRPHHGLGLQRPSEIVSLALQHNTNRVLPMYSPMTNP